MYKDTVKKIIGIIKNEVENAPDNLTEDSDLMDDIGMDSLEMFAVLCVLEDTFNIKIPDKYLRKMINIGDAAEIVCELREK